MQKRRGQATIFFILGIVLVIVFGFAFYARSILVADKVQHEADLLVSQFIGENNINYYVESCLETVTDEAIHNFSRHGGQIVFGENEWVDYYTYNGEKIPYGTVPNTCLDVTQEPPDYPVSRTKYADLETSYATEACRNYRSSGYFGMNAMNLLCDLKGANSKNNQDLGGYFSFYCEDEVYGYIDTDTIQTLLQEHIKEQMQICADFLDYETVFGDESIIPDNTKVEFTVIYTNEGTTVQGHYPFTVNVRGRNVKTFYDFTYHSPLRIKSMYEYVARLLKEEHSNPDFDLESSWSNHLEGETYNLDYRTDPCPDCEEPEKHDDVVTITEELEGENLIFRFAIKNRKPFLDFINQGGSVYDIQLREDEMLVIEPQAYDPEASSISYVYSGWKETYDEEVLHEDCFKTASDIKTCVTKIQPEGPPTPKLTDPPSFANNQDVSIALDRGDLGPHQITLTAYDETGLYDFQIINVLVYDLPFAIPKGSNQVPDIEDIHASEEDIYVLNGADSHVSYVNPTIPEATIVNYYWQFKKGTNILGELDTGLNRQPVPDPFFPSATIVNYMDFIPKAATPGETQVWELTVTDSNSAVSSPSPMNMIVHECLPVRNTGFTDMYPYASYVTANSYDHTCCNIGSGNPTDGDWGTPEPATTSCYEDPKKGLVATLSGMATGTVGTIPRPSPSEDIYIDLSENPINKDDPQYQNDPFQRISTRYCDGERGNVCGGKIENIYKQLANCDYDEDLDEQCVGADKYYTYCQEFSGKTFEKEHNIPGATGICNEDEDALILGVKECQATCASGGCTEPINCQCAKSLGAKCTTGEFGGLTGNICNYDCTTNCNFRTVKCLPAIYCDDYLGPGGKYTSANQYECDTERDISKTQFYYGKDDETRCTNAGCAYGNSIQLSKNTCFANGEAKECHPPGDDDSGCYYNPGCSATGCTIQYRAFSECPSETTPKCTLTGLSCNS